MLMLERGLDRDGVLGMVVALSELSEVAGPLWVVPRDSVSTNTDPAVFDVS
jgi:hypothetical protein